MVKVIMGVKGSGKTKLLIELVEKALEESQGDVVVIEKERSLTYDIPHQVEHREVHQHAGKADNAEFDKLPEQTFDVSHPFQQSLVTSH